MSTLYVSDLDGTLLNSNQEISQYSLKTINRLIDCGLMFTYATARSFSSAYNITKEIHLKIPIATYNGAFLINPNDGKIIEACLLDSNKIAPIFSLIQSLSLYPLVYSFINGEEKVSWVRGCENAGTANYLKSRKGDKRFRAVSDYYELFKGDIFYITIIGNMQEISSINNLFSKNSHLCYHVQEDIYNKGEYWLEIFRNDATKKHAVEKLKKYTNAERVVCFGDNINDIPMFSVSDKCYAVSNANKKLIELATEIIESNDDNGVAKCLERIFINHGDTP